MPDDVYQPFTASPFRPTSGPAPYSPFSGMPMGIFGQLLAPMVTPQGFGGHFNFGFNPSSNLAFTMDSQARTQAYYESLRQAAHRDAPLIPVMGQAYAAFQGYQWTPEMQANAQRIAGAVTNPGSGLNIGAFAPFAMQGVDIASGGMSQIPLTHHLARMDRWRTGLSGSGTMAAADYTELSQAFFDRYARDDRGRMDLANFHTRSGGFSMGQVGEMTHELSVLGQLPAGDTQRIVGRVDEYRKVVGYLRDLFVAEGRDAPIPALVASLEQLAGGMQQLDPNRAGVTLTQFAQAGKQLGYNLDTMVTVAQMSSAQAQAAGINEAFAMPVATESMLFRQDVQARGLPRAWGMPSADRLMLMYQAQQARAVNSEFGNRLGFMARMSEAHGTSIEALDAARRGDVSNAAFRSAVTGSEEKFLAEMAARTGRPIEELRSELRSTMANEEAVFNQGLLGAAKSAQNIDFYTRLERGGRGAFELGGLIAGRIGRGEGTTALAGRLDSWMRSTMQGMTAEDLGNREIRNAHFAQSINQIRKAAEGTGPEGDAARSLLREWESRGLNADEEASRMLGITFNRMSEDHRRETGRTLETEIALQQKSRIDAMASDRADVDAKATAARLGMGTVIPGIGVQGLVGRTYEQLLRARQGVGPQGLGEAVANVFGLDVNDARAKQIAEMAGSLHAKSVEVQQKRDQAVVEAIRTYGSDPEKLKSEREKIEKAYGEDIRALKAQEEKFEKFLHDPELKKKLETEKAAAEGGAGGGIAMSGVTININGGEITVRADKASGTATNRGRGEGPTPA